MKTGYDIVWAQGTFLTQQHLQQWDLCWQHRLNLTREYTQAQAYGLCRLDLDADALSQGRVQVNALVTVTHTGEWIEYQREHMPALALACTRESVQTLYLNISKNTRCEGLSGYDPSQKQAGYVVEYAEVSDRFNPEHKEEVAFKRRQLSLSWEPNLMLGDSWPIARIKQSGAGVFSLDDTFFPMALNAWASTSWQNLCEGLIARLNTRLQAVQKQLEHRPEGALWQESMVLADALCDFRHLSEQPAVHPSALYLLMSKLATKIAILKGDAFYAKPYHHPDPAEGVLQLKHQLLKLAEEAAAVETPMLSLERCDAHHYALESIPPALFKNHAWYIGVSHDSQDVNWVFDFANQVKMASKENLPNIFSAALPGVSLKHIAKPPKSIKVKNGYEYFKLQNNDTYWHDVVEKQNLKIFVPKQFETVELTVETVKE